MTTWRYTDPAHTLVTNDAGTFVPADPSNNTFAALDPAQILPFAAPAPTSAYVDAERDRRMLSFTYGGKAYQLDDVSQQRIIAATTRAILTLGAGGAPAAAGNLRWFDPATDFGWIASDNSVAPLDAQGMAAFGGAVQGWVYRHIVAARAIKDLDPIPTDFADDSRWPAVS